MTEDTKTNRQVRTRFAPSPTGYMHIGGMRTALYAYCFAKKNGGKFLLRLEDTDLERHVEGADTIIYRTLKYAGLVYDEGPDVGGDYGPYVQSQRKDIYLPHALQLVEQGDAYYCFCSKERLQSMYQQGATKYDKCCLGLDKQVAKERAKTESFVIRQNIPSKGTSSYHDCVFGTISVDNAELEDNILIKSDGYPTYNFANVVDDHLMDITHVIRGTEYLSSTPKYNLLYDAFEWQRPVYIHLQSIMRDAHNKLSKRKGDPSFEDFLAQGYLKEAILNYIALLGWSGKEDREKYSLQELVDKFGVDGISKSASIFDAVKMKWLNGLYIRELSQEQFFELAKPYLMQAQQNWGMDGIDTKALAILLQSRCELLADVVPLTDFIKKSNYQNYDLTMLYNQKQKVDKNLVVLMIPKLVELLKKPTDNLHDALKLFCTNNDYKPAQAMWILRVAITGATVTPGGATDMVNILGIDRAIERLQDTMERLCSQ